MDQQNKDYNRDMRKELFAQFLETCDVVFFQQNGKSDELKEELGQTTEPLNILMVAEKPIMAKQIAKILSDGRCECREEKNDVSPVFEYEGHFQGKRANFRVTSTYGHIMGIEFPEKFHSTSGRRVNPADLFTCPIEQKEADQDQEMKMPGFLKAVAKDCDLLVLWLDCDNEGEHICFEVIDAVWRHMRRSPPADSAFGLSSARFAASADYDLFMDFQVFRAQFSAITEKCVKMAMAELVRPDLYKSLAVEARQELDLRIGCAFTRFQNQFFKRKYGYMLENSDQLVSYGPCQMPTLALCVDRHDEIAHFRPQPFCQVEMHLQLPWNLGGGMLKLESARDHLQLMDKSTAQACVSKIKLMTEAKIVEVSGEKEQHVKDKPVALNTGQLMRYASEWLGMSPNNAMVAAQSLYSRGFSSYPRTETTSYPDSFEFKPILLELAKNPKFAHFANQILEEGICMPKSGIDKGDHPPITPMGAMNRWAEANLRGDHARLYDYIVQHFLATLMRPCLYSTKNVKFAAVGDEKQAGEEEQEFFLARSHHVLDPGFTQILTWMAVDHDDKLDFMHLKQQFPINAMKLVEKMTTAPDYLTEAELISLMEKYGIGTDASIPQHIENISKRKYVKVESGRRLVPTKLGIALVHGYRRVDPELVQPTMRANMEKQLNLIAEGKANYEMMKHQTLKMFQEKYENFVQNIDLVDAPFKASFNTVPRGRRDGIRGRGRGRGGGPFTSSRDGVDDDGREAVEAVQRGGGEGGEHHNGRGGGGRGRGGFIGTIGGRGRGSSGRGAKP